MKSQADRSKDKLKEVSRDVSATWRMAQTLLHDKQKAIFDDAECDKLVSTFSQFFINKVNRIRESDLRQHHSCTAVISSSCVCHPKVLRSKLSSFEPITVDEVDACCLRCHQSHLCWTSCHIQYSSHALTSSHQLLPDLQPVDARWKCSHPVTRGRRCCLC